VCVDGFWELVEGCGGVIPGGTPFLWVLGFCVENWQIFLLLPVSYSWAVSWAEGMGGSCRPSCSRAGC